MNGDPIADLYSSKDGVINGLNLKLYIASADDFSSFKTGNGAHIYIHNKSTKPSFFNGFDVPVNADTTLIVKKEFSTALAQPYTNCVSDSSSYGSIFTNMFVKNKMEYTQKECLKYYVLFKAFSNLKNSNKFVKIKLLLSAEIIRYM
jgi:hypothetical protein